MKEALTIENIAKTSNNVVEINSIEKWRNFDVRSGSRYVPPI